ncbi:MAG: type IX secretion system membrane protein PorP/SprF [Saprospiraceae bacterium]|nr:type IX secretion system membrane protein PorP/SprF [Saprospiraceae bacterium]
MKPNIPFSCFRMLLKLPTPGGRLCNLVWAVLFVVVLQSPARAQQEPQFTHYMFNTLVYNPGYAGSREYLSAVAVYRDQWAALGDKAGWQGRPLTQTFSIHSTFKKRVGLGFNLVNASAGARQTTYLNAIYAYRINFGKGTLSIGLQGGVMNWKADWSKLDFQQPQEIDNAFGTQTPNLWLPDFGAGLFFYTSNFYAGASMPHLANFQLRDIAPEEQDAIRKWARVHRHFYLTTGGAIPLNGDNLVFRPSFLLKSVGLFNNFFRQGNLVREIGAPSSFDLDASLFFQKKIWLGLSFRSAFAAFNTQGPKQSSYDSFDLWTTFHLRNGLRLGMSYDYPLGKLQSAASGSFELMLGYDFDQRVEKASHIRYF